jgi:hypothetical protein
MGPFRRQRVNPLRTVGYRPKRIKLLANAPPKGVEKHCLPLAPWGHFVGKGLMRPVGLPVVHEQTHTPPSPPLANSFVLIAAMEDTKQPHATQSPPPPPPPPPPY